MSRFSHMDILVELTELAGELIQDIRQQLNYYRVSVYKTETAEPIRSKIDQLRLLMQLTGDELASEPFRDHDAMVAAGAAAFVPGECSFSARTTHLLINIEEQMRRLTHKVQSREHSQESAKEFTRNIQAHRTELLTICRHGSRHRAFFQGL